MVLRRTLTRALARQSRPNLARGQRLCVIRCPQSSINERPCLNLDPAGHGALTRPYSQASSIISSQDPTAVAQADPKTTQPHIREKEQEEDPDSQMAVVETWKEAVDAVLEATRAAFPSSPAYDAASPDAFQSYWREVFTRLHRQVMSDRHIPEHLTSPPCKTFSVNVFAQGAGDEGYSCPCCLPEVEPSVRLDNPAGVTKGDLVAGLGAFLYGEELPRVYDEVLDDECAAPEEEPEEVQRTGVLVHGAGWMIQSRSGDDGERYVDTVIWMYCCQSGEFAEKAAARLRRDGVDRGNKSDTMAKL